MENGHQNPERPLHDFPDFLRYLWWFFDSFTGRADIGSRLRLPFRGTLACGVLERAQFIAVNGRRTKHPDRFYALQTLVAV